MGVRQRQGREELPSRRYFHSAEWRVRLDVLMPVELEGHYGMLRPARNEMESWKNMDGGNPAGKNRPSTSTSTHWHANGTA